MSNIYIKWIIRLAVGVLIFFLLFKYVEYSENEKRFKEISEKRERQEKVYQGLYASKLFGIQLQQQADILLFSIQNIASTYANTDKVYQENGLLKYTENLFYYDYSIKLNSFINDEGMENTNQSCVDMYTKLEKENPEKLCIKPIIKNENFSEYYIKYHPYGYRIWSIIGKLNKNHSSKKECVEDLKPYANILTNNIKKINSSERIIVEDKFYPNEKKPKIIFSHKSEFYNNKSSALIIEGVCLNNSSYISLSAPLLRPNTNELINIRNQIIENKKLNEKNELDKIVDEKEKSIDTQGLQ